MNIKKETDLMSCICTSIQGLVLRSSFVPEIVSVNERGVN